MAPCAAGSQRCAGFTGLTARNIRIYNRSSPHGVVSRMKATHLWISSIAIGSLIPAGLVLSAADQNSTSDKSSSSAPRETIAKPLSEREKKRREEKLRKELETPYKKWLDEDVRWIITDEERTAFKR